ncbi:MAG: oxidoreductase [Pseudonocardia sediminis]
MSRWHPSALDELSGRSVLVTGANSGLGLAASAALVRAGARVLMAVRDPERGRAAIDTLPGGPGTAELVTLDLADLTSVRFAAADVRERTGDRLDALLNNAGVAMGPLLHTTDGFELQIGTNHLGPAALTWQLMPALRGAGAPDRPSRVVTTSSLGHRSAALDVDDLGWEHRRYRPTAAYGASKLANLLFAAELDRRLRLSGDPVVSVAAHPGMTESQLLGNGLQRGSTLAAQVFRPTERLLTQPVEDGVAPQLAALASPVHGGDYLGPTGVGEIHGPPGPARRSKPAQDPDLAARLWRVTAHVTGVRPDPE